MIKATSLFGIMFCLLLIFCSKKDRNDHQPTPKPKGIIIKENLSRTAAYITDTMVIREGDLVCVNFSSATYYDSYEWKIGDDPRYAADTRPNLSLLFYAPLAEIKVRLIGTTGTKKGHLV